MDFVSTEDGSLTLRHAQTGEHYHNRAGAYTEALLCYVNPSGALKRLKRTRYLHLIDACFGLGYNSFVLLAEAIEQKLEGRVVIDAIDNDPNLVNALPTVLSFEKFKELGKIFELQKQVVTGPLSIIVRLHHSSLPQQLVRLREDNPNAEVDLVFHDPFSPNRMPELWTFEIFSLYKQLLRPDNGAVLTYSLATAVKGGFIQSGFSVGRTPKVGAKAGGTIAYLGGNSDCDFDFTELPADELASLKTHSAIPYRDPELQLDRLAILKRRTIEQEQFKNISQSQFTRQLPESI